MTRAAGPASSSQGSNWDAVSLIGVSGMGNGITKGGILPAADDPAAIADAGSARDRPGSRRGRDRRRQGVAPGGVIEPVPGVAHPGSEPLQTDRRQQLDRRRRLDADTLLV